MQQTGYLKVNGEKILVLVRAKKYSRQFKVRRSGRDGTRYKAEEEHLREYPQALRALRNGEVVEM